MIENVKQVYPKQSRKYCLFIKVASYFKYHPDYQLAARLLSAQYNISSLAILFLRLFIISTYTKIK